MAKHKRLQLAIYQPVNSTVQKKQRDFLSTFQAVHVPLFQEEDFLYLTYFYLVIKVGLMLISSHSTATEYKRTFSLCLTVKDVIE